MNHSNDAIIFGRLSTMKINISSEEGIPSDVIIHGKRPRLPDQSCRNCAKLFDCNILQHSLIGIGAIDFLPQMDGAMMPYGEMPFPMPCRGEAWQASRKPTVMTDPLVERLGLSGVREPVIENTPPAKPRED
jgi:hypothetical protein